METDFSGYSQASTSGPDFSSSNMGLSQGAMDSIGSDSNQNESAFGPSGINVMDFGRGSVSNITNASNYDPNFAGLGMIGRGLNPGFQTTNQMTFDVPGYLQPQLEGPLGKFGPKYYSPVERTLATMEPVGIMSMIGKGLQSIMDTAKGSFNDAKSALGLKGDAAGGLKDDDFTGMMSTRDDQLMSDMSQSGARMNVTDPVVNTSNVNMGSIPQVSPTFDAFGNVTRDADISRFADDIGQTRAGIASLLPEQNREANISVDDAVNPTSPFTDFNAKEYLDDFENSLRQRQIENNKRNRDRLLSGNKMADASTFNILQGLGTKFNPQINQILKENVNPNINFETGARRDPFDPDKLMPYMGINIPFNIG